MLLDANSAQRFIADYKCLLLEIHRQSGEVSDDDAGVIEILAAARTRLANDSSLLERTASDLAADGQSIASDILQALRSLQIGQWVYLRSTKHYAIFIDQAVENAFAVLGLTNQIEEVVGAAMVAFETAVFAFEGHFVCDGIVKNPVLLGPGYRKQFNAALVSIKKAGHFHAHPSPSPSIERKRPGKPGTAAHDKR